MNSQSGRGAIQALTTGLCLILLCVGCSDKLIPPASNSGSSTLSGRILNESGKPIPDDAAIVVLWEGRNSMYVYGRGTIDRQKNTYSITLGEPPLEGLNLLDEEHPSFFFGVGYIYVVPDSVTHTTLAEGIRLTSDYTGPFYGSTEFSGIIYLSADPAVLGAPDNDNCRQAWIGRFGKGVRFGTGVQAEYDAANPLPNTCKFDEFSPIKSGGLNLIINTDRTRFPFVNWT